MEKEIPVLTKSGGMLSDFGGKRKVLEYRVWFHYHDGRSDSWITDTNFRNIQKRRRELLKDKKIIIVEQPLAVVWDSKDDEVREVRIDGIKYE